MPIIISIFSAILLPLISLGIIVYVKKVEFIQENIKKLLSVCGIAIFVFFMLFFLFWLIAERSMYYNEILDYKIVSAKHEMEWTTEESRQVSESHTVDDGDGKSHTETTYHTEYYTEHHGPFFTLVNDCGKEIDTSLEGYNRAKKLWGEKKTGMHKGTSAGLDRKIDGDIFESYWNNSFDDIYPYSEISSYKNKVRAGRDSVFKHKNVSKEIKRKYPRPADVENTSPVVQYDGSVSLNAKEQSLLKRTNAFLGSRYQVHTMIVALNSKEAGIGVVDDILASWEGTNKNELAIFIGIDKNIVNWVKVESWMDNTELHSIIQGEMYGKNFCATAFSDMILKNIPKYWHRKEFKDFEYLQVELGGYFIAYIIFIFLISVGGTIYLFFNNIFDSCYFGYRRYNKWK